MVSLLYNGSMVELIPSEAILYEDGGVELAHRDARADALARRRQEHTAQQA